MRDFATGATRDSADWKLDLKGFLSARAVHMLGRYMHFHRKQADGNIRDSDNWKKGIPVPVYEESFTRHFWEWASALEKAKEDFEGPALQPFDRREAIVAALGMMFNLQGWLHEQAKIAERQGINLDTLIEAQAMKVKERDTAEAKRAMVVPQIEYERLQRAAVSTYEAERAAVSTYEAERARKAGGIGKLTGLAVCAETLPSGKLTGRTVPCVKEPYHGLFQPVPNAAQASEQASLNHYHRPTTTGVKPQTDEFSDDYFHPDTYAQSAVEGRDEPSQDQPGLASLGLLKS